MLSQKINNETKYITTLLISPLLANALYIAFGSIYNRPGVTNFGSGFIMGLFIIFPIWIIICGIFLIFNFEKLYLYFLSKLYVILVTIIVLFISSLFYKYSVIYYDYLRIIFCISEFLLFYIIVNYVKRY